MTEPGGRKADRLPQTPFEKFEAFVKKVVRVPKKEIDEKAKEYEAKRARRPKRA